MEADEPRPLSHDEARDALDSCGAKLECPSCDGIEWRDLGIADVFVMLDAVDQNEKPLQAGTFRVGHICVAFICGNCGFVRLHSRDELADRRDESG